MISIFIHINSIKAAKRSCNLVLNPTGFIS